MAAIVVCAELLLYIRLGCCCFLSNISLLIDDEEARPYLALLAIGYICFLRQ